MALKYLRSGAGGAATGADWANAYTTMSAAASGMSAGDTLYISEDHSESTAGAVTITFPGTAASPNKAICVNHSGSVPPVSADITTGASVATTGANGITIAGGVYCNGVTFATNTGGATGGGTIVLTSGSVNQRFDNCNFRPLSSGASAINGSAGNIIYWNNCTVKFAAAGSAIGMANGAGLFWKNSTAVDGAGTLPTTLFNDPARACTVYCENVDFSNLSSKTIFPATAFAIKAFLVRCKLPGTVTIAGTPTGGPDRAEIHLINSDSGATNYRTEKYSYAGTLTTETTIVRTGGATDGTTSVAHKIVTTANSSWSFPFVSLPLFTVWNDTTGSAITVTVYGIWGGGAVPNKEDIWIDAEYPSSSSFPLGAQVTSGNADVLATAANSSDTSTWGGSTTKFKMAVTFTPQQKGPITVYVKAALASSTFYIDPLPVIS